jgi:chorismate synthase
MRYLSGGESHGPCLTGIIEGMPAGLKLKKADINRHLKRRQRGYGRGARMSFENDRVEILSGLRFNRTIGSPLTMQIKNYDWENWRELMSPEGEPPSEGAAMIRPRPGHADLAGGLKYNHDDLRLVLERSSARETAMRVAVGSVARILLEKFGFHFISHVVCIGSATADVEISEITGLTEQIEKSPVRCASTTAEAVMLAEIEQALEEGDTLGGIIELVITGVPPGLGSHVHWDRRLDGRLAGALMSIQGIKGVECGIGFTGASLRGSKVHDPITFTTAKGINRPSNRAGGLEGGITNGNPLILRAAMKPIPTLAYPLPSIDWKTGKDSPAAVERSDVCAVPSVAVVAEAVAAWELAVAFREKFAGDFIEEVEAAYNYYMSTVNIRLRKPT